MFVQNNKKKIIVWSESSFCLTKLAFLSVFYVSGVMYAKHVLLLLSVCDKTCYHSCFMPKSVKKHNGEKAKCESYGAIYFNLGLSCHWGIVSASYTSMGHTKSGSRNKGPFERPMLGSLD